MSNRIMIGIILLSLLLVSGCKEQDDTGLTITQTHLLSSSTTCSVECSNGIAYTDTFGCKVYSHLLEEKESFEDINCTITYEGIRIEKYRVINENYGIRVQPHKTIEEVNNETHT